MTALPNQRHTYLDILRVIASFFVCYNHSFACHLFLEQAADNSLISWINVCLTSVVAINIPLFFMISGALLLNRQESYSVLFRKRVFRILVLIAAVSAITYLLIPQEAPSLKDFTARLFQGSVYITHWYLYAYLGLLMALPFLRPAVREMTGQDFRFLVILRTIFRPGLLILNFWLVHLGFDKIQLSGQIQLPLAVIDCFFCSIAGYYLAHKFSTQGVTGKQILGWAGIFFGSCLTAALMTYAEGYYYGFTQNFIGEFGYSAAIAVFVLVRIFTERVNLPEKLVRFFASAGSVVIGIYLLEPIVAHYLQNRFFSRIPWHSVPLTVFSVLWCILCMVIGGTVTWLLRKIPGVKKFL